ncbi:MAG: hypothetical protein DHS20C01_22860 [marine bacterium B5-7]|nr:MAG: hypothetical protein DHS20C01_22860 [marine bacterium B5-7]
MENIVLDEVIPYLIAIVVFLVIRFICWQIVRSLSSRLERVKVQLPGSSVWSRTNALHATLSARIPRTMRFMGSRIDTRYFNGLPLTLLIIAALYIVMLLGGLIEELMEMDELLSMDQSINNYLQRFRTPDSVAFFTWITELGSFPSLFAVVFVSSGFFHVSKKGYMILPLMVTILGSQLTTYVGKFAFDRQRPEFLTGVTALTPSFPSGHATSAIAVYGFIAYAISRDMNNLRQRFEVTYWAIALIGLIGFSRLLLSVHYASDVAAGFLVGGFWLLVGLVIAEQFRSQ